MKEVSPDSKWQDPNWPDRPMLVVPPAPAAATEENQRAILTVLMRIYDVQMAILSYTNKKAADEIYDMHSRGELANPEFFIMDFVRPESTS